MSYKEKPILRLYKYENNSFVQIAIIDDYQEVSFENNLYEAGQFSITINFNIPNSQLFQRGLFIQFGDDSYDFGEISKVQDVIDENGKISQLRIISGYDIRYILKRRIIKNMNSNGLWVMTGKGEIILRNLIKDQCGSGAETKRQLPITNVIPAPADAIGKEFSVSEQFTNLYEVCKTIATQSEIGWRIKFINGNLVLECYQGENKSQTIRFDTDYESLANGQFIDSSESFSNAIYVGGKGQNDSRDIYEGENAIEGNSPSGLDRFESWDNKSTMTIESEYEAEALSMLTQYGQTIQMQGNGLAKCPYIYKEQYNVGDIITVSFSGKSAVVQILSVTEHWSWGNYEIQFEFGKPQPNLNDQLQLILRKIQEASNKTDSTESVKWYTMSNNIIMDKKDVTYNTIGFTGTLTANRTFRFYWDNQKTGSKSYTIYAKNLSGNYTLTLRTGKSGATTVTLKGGTNVVARILVDEDGNIVNQGMTATSTIEAGNNQPVTSNAVAEEVKKLVPSSTLTNVDLDTVTTFGMYRCNYSVSHPDTQYHYPVTNYGVLIVVEADGNKGQIFVPDTQNSIYKRSMSGVAWASWVRIITSENITDSVTNANMNPVTSNAVYWASWLQSILYIRDTRTENYSPSYYLDNYKYRITAEFKSQTAIGDPFSIGSGFCVLITITPWGDTSGGYPIQIAIDTQFGYGLKRRIANASLGWNSWGSL